MRIKEQETRLTLQEHDDDDDEINDMWEGNIANNNGKMRNIDTILNADSERKKLLGRSERIMEDNIKFILK